MRRHRLIYSLINCFLSSCWGISVAMSAESSQGYTLTGLSRIESNEYAFILVPPSAFPLMLKKGAVHNGLALVEVDFRLGRAVFSRNGQEWTLELPAVQSSKMPTDEKAAGPINYEDFSLANYNVLKQNLRAELALREQDWNADSRSPIDIKLLDKILQANPESLSAEDRNNAASLLDNVYKNSTPGGEFTQLVEYHMWYFMQLK